MSALEMRGKSVNPFPHSLPHLNWGRGAYAEIQSGDGRADMP